MPIEIDIAFGRWDSWSAPSGESFDHLCEALLQLIGDLDELGPCGVVGRGDDDVVALHAVDIAAVGIADETVGEALVAHPGEELESRIKGLLAGLLADKLDP